MNIWKKNEDTTFSKVKRLTEGLADHSPHSAVQKITRIFNALFQSYNQSLLSNLYEEGFKKNSKDAKMSLIYAIQLFSPESQFGKAIVKNRDAKIEIDNLDYSSDFDNYLRTSELTKKGIAKKEDYTFRIPLLDCFFVNLALCLTALKDQQRRIQKWEQAFFQDEFYVYIVRNPILIIIKNWLTHSKSNYSLYSRILRVLEIILLRDLSIQAKKTERATIKSTIIYGIYVISDWKVCSDHWEALESITDNMERRGNSANLLTLWIRINLAILLNGTSFEERARRELRQFNMKNSELSRKYFNSFAEIDQHGFRQVDSHNFSSFLFKVEALVQKNFWECSPLFLQQIFILISIVEKIFPSRQECEHRLSFLKKIFKKGVLGLRSQNKIKLLGKIKNSFENKISKIEDDEEEQNDESLYMNQSMSSVKRTYNRQNRNRRSLVSYQGDLSSLNIWQKPIQHNESAILYTMSKWFARKVDKVRKIDSSQAKKGHQSYPSTDLRFLASPKYFILILLLFLLPIYVIFM